MKLFLYTFLLSISSFCYLTTDLELPKEVTGGFPAPELIQMPELAQEQPGFTDGISNRPLSFKSRTNIRKLLYSANKLLSSRGSCFSLFSTPTHFLPKYCGFLARLNIKGFYLYYFQKLTV